MSKINYLLALDGGGTKITAHIIHLNSDTTYVVHGSEASLSNNFQTALNNIEAVIHNLLEQSNAKLDEVIAVMGVAGGGSKELSERLTAALELGCDIKFAQLYIYSDAISSLYGANEGKPVAMVALGTGAVGARLTEDGNTHLVGGWGFMADDFGGGAHLGLSAVQALLNDIDCFGAPHSKVTKQIANLIGCQRAQLSAWLYTAKAIDYARFTYLIFELQDDCEVAHTLLKNHARQVEYLIEKTRANSDLPVMLTGGLADVTIALLNQQMQQLIIPRLGDSLRGATFLAHQHLQNDYIG